jgi:hypothetical protein
LDGITNSCGSWLKYELAQSMAAWPFLIL